MRTIIASFLICFGAFAQNFPEFKQLRYNEDYSNLNRDTLKHDWYTDMKYLPLSSDGNIYASFGGSVRYQYFYIKNGEWGQAPEDTDGYVLSRLLLHSDIHVGKALRTFVQLQGSMANSKIAPSPVDEDPLDLHQAFIDIKLSGNSPFEAVLRAGRQEMLYGIQRFVSVREGPNNRQSFDGAKLMLHYNKIFLDGFYTRYVLSRKKNFDDKSSNDYMFWGSYMTLKDIFKGADLEAYYFGYKRDNAHFNEGVANEMRHTTGAHFSGRYKNWRYDLESAYQFGSFGNQSIRAWTYSVNTGYKFSTIKFKPELGFKGEFISGDRAMGDGRLGTFNPMFPKGGYFGLAALIGPSNLIDLHPSLVLNLEPKLAWNIDCDLFCRYHSQDGIYGPSTALIFPAGEGYSKHIGTQLATDFSWQASRYLALTAEFTYFFAGEYLKQVSAGRDILFTGLTMHLTF